MSTNTTQGSADRRRDGAMTLLLALIRTFEQRLDRASLREHDSVAADRSVRGRDYQRPPPPPRLRSRAMST